VQIALNKDIKSVVDKVLEVWAARFCVFQSCGQLLELQTDPGKEVKFLAREKATPRMVAVNGSRAWFIAGRECRFTSQKMTKAGEVTVEELPPEWLGRALVTLPAFPNIPVFSALAQAPTLRPDGALLQEPGYDTSTGIYLASDLVISIPIAPTLEDARAALGRLLDLIRDFDFINPAGRSVWVAGLLSVVCRHTFNGPAPIFIIDASKRGSGKTMLADLASIIATGNRAPKMFYTHDDVEMDKRISSLAIAGDAMVLVDNIVGKLASPPLDAALTSTTYRGRVLGKSEMTPALSMKIVWFATGNGLIIGADTARRALFARLEPPVDHPEDRTGPRDGETWRYPDPLGYAKANRASLLGDALTVVAAFILGGRRVPNFAPMGSFEAWSSTIRAAIVSAGGEDPCATIRDARAADLEELALKTLIAYWPATEAVSAADLIERATIPIGDPLVAPAKKAWRNALLGWLPAKGGAILPTARDLGYALRSIKDAIIGNFKIHGTPEKNGILWERIRVTAEVLDFEQKNELKDPKTLPPSPSLGVMG
jgi:putative DNA primase/helicase